VSDTHFYGIYRGICMDNRDPENHYRLRLQIPQIFHNVTLPYWAWPCLPAGWRDNLVKAHADHTFLDHDDGMGASGSVNQTLAHTNNHTLSKPVPDIGTGVWVMFEGGDPDRPVWMGTF
jgi:hypothetical protein